MSRDYGKVAPGFWTGKTGKALKAKGTETVIVALYLMTCQHANMLGLYYLSKTYIAVDTPLGFEGACKGLQGAIEAGFCQYDDESEMVWVMEMASYQIGAQLEAKDNQCKGVQRQYDALPENPYLARFYERYAKSYHMTSGRGQTPKKTTPSKGPRKPLRSQEQEQEQEQEHEHEKEQEQEHEQDGNAGARAKRSTPPSQKSAGALTFDAYADAYRKRYEVDPVSNVKVRSQMSQLVQRIPAEEAPHVAAWFLSHNNRYYVERGHSVDALLHDCEKLRTQWATNRQVTATQAMQADKTQTNFSAFAPLLAEARAAQERNHVES